jgi:uncharacterized protein YdhG (YjbR/CyaY superfamily)
VRQVSGTRKSPAKRKTHTVEEYLAAVPENARSQFLKLRLAVQAAVPRGATDTISYGIPAFKHKGATIWYAAFSKHCSLFPTASVIEAFKSELRDFTISKGTIHFPLDKPLPLALIKRIVKARFSPSKPDKKRYEMRKTG